MIVVLRDGEKNTGQTRIVEPIEYTDRSAEIPSEIQTC